FRGGAVAVPLRFLVELGRDASGVVKARAEHVARGAARSGEPRDETEPRKRARPQEERDVAPETTWGDEEDRACPHRRGHGRHVSDRTTHRVPGDVRAFDPDNIHRGHAETWVDRLL